MTSRSVELTGGSPWGFRMHGGVDVNQPLRISRVNPGRKAALSGIREGDVISSINNVPTKSLTNAQAHAMLKNSGDILKLGLNEDSVGSPRRRSAVKANGLELKRPSQLLAEMQGIASPQTPKLVKPETKPSLQTSPRIIDQPLPSNPVSSFSSSSQNLFREIPPHSSVQYTSNSLNRQISPQSSSQSASNCSLNHPHISIPSSNHFDQTTSPSKFTQSSSILATPPFDNELSILSTSRNTTLTEPKTSPSSFSNQLSLRSPSLPGSSPTKSGVSPVRRASPFSSLESTSLVKSSIRPSITMPTITPPTVTFPSYSSSETDCNRTTPQQYSNHSALNSSVSSPFPASSIQNPTNSQLFKSDVSNTTYSSLGYMPTFNAESLMTSPRSPMNSLPYIPGSCQVSSTVNWPNSSVLTSSNSPFVQSNPQLSSASYLPHRDQTHNQYSSYFPLSTTPSLSNFSKPLTTTASNSPFVYSDTPPVIHSAPISSTYSSKMRQPSPFSTSNIPNNVQKTPISTSPMNSKTSLSSITFPHYLLYSTPTTTIKSTNPFMTNEYMVTKTEISEQSITETEEVTTTKKFSLNGYDEPSSQAFDKALSALRINGACNSDFRPENNDATLAPLSPYKPTEGKPPRTPQDFSPKSVWSPGGSASHASSSFTSTKTTTSGNPPPSASATQNGNSSIIKATPPTNTSKFISSLSESFEHRTTVLNDSRKVTSSFENGVATSSSESSSIPVSSSGPAPAVSAPRKSPSPSGNPPPPPPPPLPVWKPRSQPPSPAQEKKEFKPVTFESPTLARKNLQQEQTKSEAPPPWESRLAGSRSAPAAPGLSGLAAPPAPPPPPSLPRAQNPTITLLQKAREGQLPRGAAYLQQDREREPPRDRRSPPRTNQGEVVYTLRREYASDTETGGSRRRMAEPKKYDGIGPTTKEGMPIVLRSEVKEGNQTKWYKKMYDTIHRNKFDDDYVTVRYKSRRAHPSVLHPGPRTTQYAYFDPRSGYLSEPEGGRAGWASDAYDSDASAKVPGRRHSTLDRRGKENEAISEYLPSNTKYSTLASAKASQEVYKNQPGRIEDYVPGRSSVVDKEAKQWWDEVMDIFDGQLANTSAPQHPQINNKQSASSSALSKSYMARAFKESGYESDSTLVFRRRGVNGGTEPPLSPRDQRQAYREVQAGGEPPLHGFRKPAPDRPKDDTEIEYFPLSPTLTRIRVHKNNISRNINNDVLCYPITAMVTDSKRILESYERNVPSFFSLDYPKASKYNPPAPPRRLSSKANTTLKLVSSVNSSSSSARLLQTQRNKNDTNIKYLQGRLSNKLTGPGPQKEIRKKDTREIKMKSTDGKRIKTTKTTMCLPASSHSGKIKSSSKSSDARKRTVETVKGTSSFSSPRRTMSPVEYASPNINRYFGEASGNARIVIEGGAGRRTPISGILDRGTSLDRTFASEKKLLPLKSIKESPNKILSKSAELISPTEVNTTPEDTAEGASSNITQGTTVKQSTVLYASAKNGKNIKEDKSLKVSVSISPRGRDLLRTSDKLYGLSKYKSPTSSEFSSQTYIASDFSNSKGELQSHKSKISSSKAGQKKMLENVASKTKTSTTSLNNQKSIRSTSKTKASERSGSLSRSKKLTKDENDFPKCKSEKLNGKKLIKKIQSNGEKTKKYVSLNQILKQKNQNEQIRGNESLAYIKCVDRQIDSCVRHYENTQSVNFNEIYDRRHAMMSDTFFQHLFLRDIATQRQMDGDFNNYHATSVLEKAKLFQNSSSLYSQGNRHSNSYLSHKRPVSESKFRTWDRNEFVRSKSPRAISWPGRMCSSNIRKFDSLASGPLSLHGVGSSLIYPKTDPRSRSEPPASKVVTRRSKSPSTSITEKIFDSPNKVVYKRLPSPPAKIIFSQTSRPLSPIVIHNKRKSVTEPERVASSSKIIFSQTSRPVAPMAPKKLYFDSNTRSRSESPCSSKADGLRRNGSVSPKRTTKSIIVPRLREQSPSPSPMRSPSCRRIHSTRLSQYKAAECLNTLKKKIVRTQSAGDAQLNEDNRFHELERSSSSADLEQIRQHLDYQEYITELKHQKTKSDRFKELNRFYSYLERIGELERTTSTSDLRPRKRDEEIIDFERWKMIRAKERAEEELNRLYKKMKVEQRDKDLLFLPHDSENIKWSKNIDWNLRVKEKSVEDLKEHFSKIADREYTTESFRRNDKSHQRDAYTPLWRGNSVVNLATSISNRNQQNFIPKTDRVSSKVRAEPTITNIRERLGIGSRLWSSLSMEQVNALKSQLNSIYSKEFESKQKDVGESNEDYVITVPGPENNEMHRSLQVRCNSFTAGDHISSMEGSKATKADSISSMQLLPMDKDTKNSVNTLNNLSEKDKKRISMTLSKEVLERVKQSKDIYSPLILAKETRGATATARIRGISHSRSGTTSPSSSYDRPVPSPSSSYDHTVPVIGKQTIRNNMQEEMKERSADLIDLSVDEVYQTSSPLRPSSASETETGSSETSNQTVIYCGIKDEVKKKVDFFEKSKQHPVGTIIYHARDDSSEEKPDESLEHFEEVKIPSPPPYKIDVEKPITKKLNHSQSYSNLKELFGETQLNNLPSISSNVNTTMPILHRTEHKSDSGNLSLASNLSSSENISRSRSLSPDPERYWRAYLSLVKAGEVGNLKRKFEFSDFFNDIDIDPPTLRRHQSDPEIVRTILQHNWKKRNMVNVKRHERGDVDRLTHKYEISSRSRSRNKRYGMTSPIPKSPLRHDNRDMPHIDVISKLASLKPRSLTAPSRVTSNDYPSECPVGEVERIRQRFERENTSLLGQMFTSAPDIHELRDIAPYLSGSWTAHKFPKRQDNNRSASTSDYISEDKYSPVRRDRSRPKSMSPVRVKSSKPSSILKQSSSRVCDVFADQEFDPLKHRPRFRYQPPMDEPSPLPPRPPRPTWPVVLPTYTARPTVTFKDPELAPIPPPKGISNNHYNSESPRRYVESDVNIHYRVPVRQEPRPLVPEEELARRQADHMRRVYQEERRRKYLQELQDMNSRRHTDNFTPAQKSPIPLNRYDTFGSTGQLRPHQVARALHNFAGQSPRELSFRKGDLILVRRRIDHNWFEGEYDGQVGLFPSNYAELIDNEAPLTSSQTRPSEGRARAKFNFLAHTHLELGLKKGELVTLTRRVDENWYEGKLGGRKGIFPVSYVEVLVEPQPNRADLAPSLTTGKPVASPAAHSVVGAAGAASLGAHHYTPQLNSPALSNSPSSTAPLTLPSHGISNHHARPASATLPRAADPSPVNLNNHEPLYVDTNAEAVPYRAMYKYRPQNPDELELQEGDTVYVLEKCDDGWYVGSSQRSGRFGTFPGNYVEKI